MGRMGRMGRMIMGLWNERTILWGTMGLWDSTPVLRSRHALRTTHYALRTQFTGLVLFFTVLSLFVIEIHILGVILSFPTFFVSIS